ncbi:nuclear transcription factor Y subunit B-5 [Eucalyptus grandis]|uniref:Uncharacterized protein n=2 Tax=Eucalyptus grandis TaxID=71139 RepID=A0ACC3JWT3_EUCGR|nr:nuclear transcription factor Y subunit B-5 [Eucalyptus grandis]KAK3418578.1 hypothetical protein EUGRSUZ_H04502 [Eucalyptus grandis]
MVDEQEKLLPIANVGRIMKLILPPSAKISKEAKQTIQECASEFISFVTGEASDKCHKENRKTVNGDDICWALSSLGFDDYAEAIVRYLHKYREHESERANCKQQTSKARNVTGRHDHEDKVEGEDDDDDDDEGSCHTDSQRGKGITSTCHRHPAPLEFRIIDRNETSPS